jgi:VWFA-related protein
MPTPMRQLTGPRASLRRASLGLFAAALGISPPVARQQAPPTAAQQRPVFRGGTHFVRVDAYPTRDGRIVEGLTPDDFEILEDGKPQKIESFDYIKYDTFTPDVERRDPSSQQEALDLAADPRRRVFVIFVDMFFSSSMGAFKPVSDLPRIEQPLVNFLDRVLGPEDLYGFLTSRNSVHDLVLARKTTATRAAIQDLWRSSVIDRDEADELDRCGCGTAASPQQCDALLAAIKGRHRLDATYTALHDLVLHLGAIRQERKNIVFVTNSLSRARPTDAFQAIRGPSLPRTGISNGRITTGDRTREGGANEGFCASEFQRLGAMDFDSRYRELLQEARQQNVSFYVITPAGVRDPRANDDLISLANETDGIAVVETNDLNTGMRRIADDLSAYYLLGYYTTNMKWDGGIRSITVRLKSSGTSIRARRQYRAPTPEEIAALAGGVSPSASTSAASAAKPDKTAGDIAAALGALDRSIAYAQHGSAVRRMMADADKTLVPTPHVYRVVGRLQPEEVTVLQFPRTDRLRFEWAAGAALDRHEVRVLDRTGKPLPIDLALREEAGGSALTYVADLPLAPFTRGDYIVEFTAGSGDRVERTFTAFRVTN